MRSYRLFPTNGRTKDAWLLEWDDQRFILEDPDGQRVLETEVAVAHRVLDLSEAFIDGTIGLVTPQGTLSFKQNRAALADLQNLMDAGLRADPEYRASMRQRALLSMPVGAIMFLVGGSLFGCCCWYMSWAPEPPADSGLHTFRWLIKAALVVLIALTFMGLGLGCYGLRLWWRVRRIERTVAVVEEK